MTLLLSATTCAFADVARPDKSPKQAKSLVTYLNIRLDRDAKEAKLIIPKSQIQQLRAALNDADNETDSTAAVTGSSYSRTQTIMSGVFLSLAIVFGGMWFVRSGKASTMPGKTLIILAVITGIGSVATFVYANAGPPPEARSITSKLFDQRIMSPYRFASGQIRVETTTEGEGIILIVPDSTPKPGEE
jgi:hypothetical protein